MKPTSHFSVPQRRGSAGRLLIVIFAALVVAGVIAAVVWFSLVRKPRQAMQMEQDELLQKLALGTPISNALDTRYTDADGDLVADAPASAAAAIDPAKLTFSYIPVEDANEFKGAFKDLMAELSRATGRPVEYMEFESTLEQLRALREGKLHIAGFNTGGVPIAVDAAGFVPVSLLAGTESNGFYKMQLIARSSSSIQNPADLKGRELTLTEASSNSGYKAPLIVLRDMGLLPGRDYGLRYSLGQDASIDGIANGQFECAAVASDVLQRAIGAGRIKADDFRVIYESGDFPSAAIGYAHNLKPDVATKVRDVLTNFNWANTSMSTFFSAAGQTRFTPVEFKKHWEQVRRIDDQIGYAHRLPSENATTQPGQ